MEPALPVPPDVANVIGSLMDRASLLNMERVNKASQGRFRKTLDVHYERRNKMLADGCQVTLITSRMGLAHPNKHTPLKFLTVSMMFERDILVPSLVIFGMPPGTGVMRMYDDKIVTNQFDVVPSDTIYDYIKDGYYVIAYEVWTGSVSKFEKSDMLEDIEVKIVEQPYRGSKVFFYVTRSIPQLSQFGKKSYEHGNLSLEKDTNRALLDSLVEAYESHIFGSTSTYYIVYNGIPAYAQCSKTT